MTTVNLENVLYTRSDDGVNYGDVASLTDDDILRMVFQTEEHAYDFYQKLGRRRPHKPETRTNCEARMCIYLDRSNNIWRVKKVIMKHNHALTHPGMVHLIPNFQSVTEAAKAQIDGMQGLIYGDPVLTTSLDSLEWFAARVYTRTAFNDVKKELEAVASVNFVGVRQLLTTKVYTVDEFGHPGRPIVILCDKNMGRLQCDCYFWDTHGYPCKHMFFVMKHEHVMEVPKCLVLKRWTKDAKHVGKYVEKNMMMGALHSASHWLFFLGAQQFGLFTEAMKGLQELRAKLEEMFSKKGDGKGDVTAAELRDPDVVRTNGALRVRNKTRTGGSVQHVSCRVIPNEHVLYAARKIR
ncbi:hypothetical protein Ahy_A07g037199 [Arachis hypogaea]|uniref:SWIM-type domain-containing protein n=1 Tax=Arachis hypogaea TaxID=3818 RepID=A0A445CI17_ARAHY|nr:hypothetical protein Ahy_A07g037199 [Arachis hypogaea]